MSPVNPGQIRLYDHALPALPPGEWALTAQASLSGGGVSLSAAPEAFPVHVQSPRLRLLPEDVISVWPPPEAREANRLALPHIVLRDRTFPWARARLPTAESAGRPIPWVALLLLDKDEVTLDTSATAADLTFGDVTALDQRYPRLPPTEPCVTATIRQSVLKKLLPLRDEELPWLAHVREVSTKDREAKGDDDGFVAIVLGNRLPDAPDAEYVAVLVSLEALLPTEALFPTPAEADTAPTVGGGFVVDPGVFVRRPRGRDVRRRVTDGLAGADRAAVDAGIAAITLPPAAVRGDARVTTLPSAAGAAAEFVLAVGQVDGLTIDPSVLIDAVIFDPVTRLPALHHWSFRTAAGDTDFETLIKAIGNRDTAPVGVSLFGTAAEADLATGHVAVPHTRRSGQSGESVYRSPLLPYRVERGSSGVLGDQPIDSRQLLRALPVNGAVVEDLTYAAAFEIGRLLALSNREVLQSLAAWREAWKAGRTKKALELTRPDLLHRPDLLEPGRFGVLHELGLDLPVLDPLGPLIQPGTFRALVSDPTGVAAFVGVPSIPGMDWTQLTALKGIEPASAMSLAAALEAPAFDPGLVFEQGPGAAFGFDDIVGATPIDTSSLDLLFPQLDELLLLDPSQSGGG